MRLIPPFDNSYRVIRGGSWNTPSRSARVAYRLGWTASNRYSILGFRLYLGVR